MKIVTDGSGVSLGRLASYAAKKALLGNDVIVLNCNHVMIVGNKATILEKYKKAFFKTTGSLKAPKYVKRNPERIVKRTVRGMLEHKKGSGSKAFDRVMCYNEVPEEFKSEKPTSIEKTTKVGMTVKELASLI